MTRSDIILAMNKTKSQKEKDILLKKLHNKIENVYRVVLGLEQQPEDFFKEIGALLRKALES